MWPKLVAAALFVVVAGCRSAPVTVVPFPDGGDNSDGGMNGPDLAPPPAPAWHWESPRPQGNNLRTVFAVPGATVLDDELFVAGDSGTLFHRAHGVWDQVDVNDLLGFDGSTILALQGGSSQDLLAVGVYDMVLDGRQGSWTPDSPIQTNFGDGLLTSVWAAPAAGEYYVVGTTARVYHVQDGLWTLEGQGLSSMYLGGVSGTGTGAAQEVFAAGAQGSILHKKGGQWAVEAAGLTVQQLNAVAALPGGECYAVGQGGTVLHRLMGTWTAETVPTTASLYGVWASGDQIFAVGGQGTVIRRVGGVWQLDGVGVTTELLSAVYGVARTGQTTLYAVGNLGTILRRDTSGWTSISQAVTTNPLAAVWARKVDEVYAVGPGGAILRRTGTPTQGTWTPEGAGVTAESLVAVSGYAAAAGGDAEVYAVGTTGTILHRSAGTWTVEGAVLTGADLSGVWVGPDAVYAVGAGGRIFQKTQGAWASAMGPQRMTAVDLSAVWGAGQGTDRVVYIGATDGTIYRLSQGVWTQEGTALTTEIITALFGTSAEDVYAMGPKGTVLHRQLGKWGAETLNLKAKSDHGVAGCVVPGSDQDLRPLRAGGHLGAPGRRLGHRWAQADRAAAHGHLRGRSRRHLRGRRGRHRLAPLLRRAGGGAVS